MTLNDVQNDIETLCF